MSDRTLQQLSPLADALRTIEAEEGFDDGSSLVRVNANDLDPSIVAARSLVIDLRREGRFLCATIKIETPPLSENP